YLSRSQVEDLLASTLGGCVAEKAVFGEMSSGAGDDIARATALARAMVIEYGMSARVGVVAAGGYSARTAEVVDEEVGRLVAAASRRAAAILAERRPLLDRLAHELVRCETLEAASLERL